MCVCVCVWGGGGGEGKCTYPAHCRALWLAYRTFDVKVIDSQPGLYRCVVPWTREVNLHCLYSPWC